MNARCPLCAREAHFRFRVRDHEIVRCAPCDLEFVHPMPSEAQLASVYAQGYFSGGGHGYADYFGRERADADAKARDRVAKLSASGACGRWLDVGCADGRFVLEATRCGFDAYGVEVSSEARAQIEPSLRDRIASELPSALARGPFDVLTFWDVLEHLPDPIATLRQIAPHLAPDALVGVVVPVIDNLNARLAPRSWDQYKPPEHLWFFSRRSIAALLETALGATLMLEHGAWHRDARVFLPREDASWFHRRSSSVEARLARALQRAEIFDRWWFEDSVLVIAKRSSHL